MRIDHVTEYVADDGKRFKEADRCDAYEKELAVVSEIMARLLPQRNIPSDCYVQHNKSEMLQAKRKLWALLQEKYGNQYTNWLGRNADTVDAWIIRHALLLDVGDWGPLEKAWYRITTFNFDLGREYNQPYFANNPDEAPHRLTDPKEESHE